MIPPSFNEKLGDSDSGTNTRGQTDVDTREQTGNAAGFAK
jgi:hypothetical protein